jgi:hypothetical protein
MLLLLLLLLLLLPGSLLRTLRSSPICFTRALNSFLT